MPHQEGSPGSSPAITRALAWVLRPLVRLALNHGITYPAMAEMLKGLFIEVARGDFRLAQGEPSDSRINLLTGIHRKEIRRLRESAAAGEEPAAKEVSLAAQLVAAWVGGPPFADPNGQPRPLPRLSRDGGEASFETLVETVSRDIRSRVVLDEWLRTGMVSIGEGDQVILNTESFVPASGLEEKAYYLGHNLRDHAAVAVANVIGGEAPRLERSVFYDALSPASIAELEALARVSGMSMLKALNSRAIELERRDAGSQAPMQRFTCGVYFHGEAMPPTEGNKE